MGWFNKSSESVNNTELNELKDKVDELQSTVDFYKEEIRNSFNKRKAAFSKVKEYDFIDNCKDYKQENVKLNKKIDELEQDIKTLENEKTISIKGRKSDNFAWKKKLNIQINLYNDLKEEFNLLDMRYEQLASTGDPKIRILTENKLLKEKVKDLENELNKYSSEGNDSKKEEIDTYNL